MDIVAHPSPNFNARRHGAGPDMVVLHYTAMASAEEALARLCDPAAEVSAHYLIAEDGRIWALVAEEMRAWHAGAGAWGRVEDVNSHSIGIELANLGDRPFPEAQMAALEALLAEISSRWAIRSERVIGHSDMAPDRKRDPGPQFDWWRLARAGLSVWAAPQAADPEGFFEDAVLFGYRGSEADVLRAFRLRFRPYAEGALSAADAALMRGLAAAYPCLDPGNFSS